MIAGAIAAWAAACGGATVPIADDGGAGGDGGVVADGGDSGTDDGGPLGDGGGPGDDGGGGGSDGGRGGGDGGLQSDGGASVACSAQAPQSGGACPVESAVCEYGGDPKVECNTLAACTLGHWSLPPRGACAPAGATCPASYAEAGKQKTCDVEFLDCAYAEGQCNCNRGLRIGGVTVWACTPTSPGCASPRPRLGSSCATPGLVCDYGACTGGVAETCQGGFWQRQFRPCPG